MRSPALRFTALVLLIAVGLVVAYQLGIVDWLREGSLEERMIDLRGERWTPLAILALFVLAGCLPLPVTPVVLVSGAVYGPWVGWAINWLGCFVGGLAGHALARSLGRDFVAGVLGERRWEKLDALMNQHGFWAMTRARLMLPFPAVNFGGALAGMRRGPFLLSTLIGTALPLALYTYVGHLLVSVSGTDPARALRNAALAVAVLLLMSFSGPLWRLWRRRRRPQGPPRRR